VSHSEKPRGRRGVRLILTGLAVAGLAAATMTATAGVASARDGRPSTGPYLARLLRAEHVCLEQATLPIPGSALARCVGDLAAPDPNSAREVDLWYLFRDCLYIASQQVLDQAAPPTSEDYEDYVNECMGL
jgi:hypothetical protein